MYGHVNIDDISEFSTTQQQEEQEQRQERALIQQHAIAIFHYIIIDAGNVDSINWFFQFQLAIDK